MEPNFTFGHVSERYRSIYFVHEVNEYDGILNSGAVSRWEINANSRDGVQDSPIRRQEVRHSMLSLYNI